MSVHELSEKLDRVGIPYIGVNSRRIIFYDSATPQQKLQGQAIFDAHDFRQRKPRPLLAIMTDIQALSANDQRKLQLADLAQFLIDNPRFAERLNIPISGDEPEE